jgi:hypothetical protein
MVTTRPWWRVLVGGEAWWWCFVVPGFFCGQGSGEILVALSDQDTVPPQFLPEGHLGNPRSTLLRVPGETLGPSGSGSCAVLTVLSFLKGLLGSGRFGALEAWWDKSEGAAVVGLHHLVNSSLPLFFFFWACFCYRPSIFVGLNYCIVGVIAILI